ncbi:MAG TPA: hypothetical protein PK268_03760 [Enterococcus sp.]|nr:hypothetical protein [Enterococcus sp.]HPR81003.1 hypothetical protein [Enterococcus sp.]
MSVENNGQQPLETFAFNSDFAKRYASLLGKENDLTNEQVETLGKMATREDQELQAREFAVTNKNKYVPGSMGRRLAQQNRQQPLKHSFFGNDQEHSFFDNK